MGMGEFRKMGDVPFRKQHRAHCKEAVCGSAGAKTDAVAFAAAKAVAKGVRLGVGHDQRRGDRLRVVPAGLEEDTRQRNARSDLYRGRAGCSVAAGH